MKAICHEKTEYVPCWVVACKTVGFGEKNGIWFEKGLDGEGFDAFGVEWHSPASGGGAAVPDTTHFILEDITDWKEIVTFPDVDAFDWEKKAETELAGYNPDAQWIDYGLGNGVYERLAALMGFEEALIALYTEPEACYELMEAVTDYKIKVVEKVARYYKADFFTNYDDIATDNALFMSPETYRTLIMPHHKRLNDAVRNAGMIPILHCCGNAQEAVEDFIASGVEAWTSVQPVNDINGILEKHGDKITLIGGYDTNGAPGHGTSSDEVVYEEVERCLTEYGDSRSFVFFGHRLVNSLDPMEKMNGMRPIFEAYFKYLSQYEEIPPMG